MRTLNLRTRCGAIVLAATLASGCTGQSLSPEEHASEVLDWQEWRLADLTSEDSWLSLVGFHLLDPGTTTLGTSADADIVTARGPELIGRLEIEGDRIRFVPGDGAHITADSSLVPMDGIEVLSERDGSPTVMRVGDISWYIRFFQDRFALRLRDNQNPKRTEFPGLDFFSVNGNWRLSAHFEAYDPPKKFPVAIFTGGEALAESPGAVIFEVDGTEYRLDVTDTSDTGYFVIFSDKTNRDDSYQAGRYVWFDRPTAESGPVILDFNRSYSPPCAFTDFATCPLPPRSHRIDARIEAGELRPVKKLES